MDLDYRSQLVEIVATLKEITALITTSGGLTDAAEGLAKATGDILPTHIRCGVTLVSEGMPAILATAGLPDDLVDETLYSDGDGPCLAAIRDRDVMISHDLGAETRWPVWTGLARQHGIHGVLSYPFDVDTFTLGAVNLYVDRPQGLADDAQIIAMLVADHAGLLLRARRQQLLQDEHFTRVMEASTGEAVVERAVGIVMAQRGCAPEQALRHLYDAASHLGVEVNAVAQRLVQTVSDRAAQA